MAKSQNEIFEEILDNAKICLSSIYNSEYIKKKYTPLSMPASSRKYLVNIEKNSEERAFDMLFNKQDMIDARVRMALDKLLDEADDVNKQCIFLLGALTDYAVIDRGEACYNISQIQVGKGLFKNSKIKAINEKSQAEFKSIEAIISLLPEIVKLSSKTFLSKEEQDKQNLFDALVGKIMFDDKNEFLPGRDCRLEGSAKTKAVNNMLQLTTAYRNRKVISHEEYREIRMQQTINEYEKVNEEWEKQKKEFEAAIKRVRNGGNPPKPSFSHENNDFIDPLEVQKHLDEIDRENLRREREARNNLNEIYKTNIRAGIMPLETVGDNPDEIEKLLQEYNEEKLKELEGNDLGDDPSSSNPDNIDALLAEYLKDRDKNNKDK